MKNLLLKISITLALLVSMCGARAAMINVANDGIAYSTEPLYANWSPGIIIDGNPRNVAHANVNVADGFSFTIDLGQDRSVSSVKIYPRQDGCCAERLTNFRVSLHSGTDEMGAEVWGTDLYTDGTNPGAASGTIVDVPVAGGPKTARWVEIRSLASPVLNYALQMAEVEVMAVVPENQVNRAFGGIATSNQALFGGGGAGGLVDGARAGQVHGTDANTAGFAYSIDMRVEVDINKIVLFPRQDGCCAERLANVRVSVHKDNAGAPGDEMWSADILTDGSNAGSGAGIRFDVTKDLDPDGVFKGQWVKITALTDPPDAYSLQLSEVEVLGTPAEGIKLILLQEPRDTAARVGGTATLQVGVNPINGDSAKLTYQWLKNGVAIEGATSATYTTGILLASDGGNKYSVVVSHPGAPSVTSREATVKVNLAAGATAFTNRPLWPPGGWNINQIVNGNRNDFLHADQTIAPGFAYTIKLASPVKMDELDLWPRQDGCCADRLRNIRVSLHDDNNGAIGDENWSADLLTDGSNAGSGAGIVYPVLKSADPDGAFEGQWIKILVLDEEPVTSYALQMGEVEVFGTLVDNAPKITVNALPAVLNAAPGRSNKLAVSASVFNGLPANLTYQWNRNGVPIQGATATTYSTPSLLTTDEGAKYTVTVSYPGVPSVTSNESVVTWDYNYARGGTASSNGKLWVGVPSWNFGMLVDGDKQSVVHGDTGISAGFAYTVNLGSEVDLDEIRIYPRQDGCCATRLTNLRVTVHSDNNGQIGNAVWTANIFTDGTSAESAPGALVTLLEDLDPAGTFKGQWIRVQSLDEPPGDYALQMTEIEAIGRIQIVEPPTLQIAKTANGARITWNSGTLEFSTTLLPGSWTTVQENSPYDPPISGFRYYRVRK